MSKHVIYDIETEILYETCFVHNSTQKVSPEKRSPLLVSIFLRSIFLAYQNKFWNTFQNLTFTYFSSIFAPGERLSYEACNVIIC